MGRASPAAVVSRSRCARQLSGRVCLSLLVSIPQPALWWRWGLQGGPGVSRGIRLSVSLRLQGGSVGRRRFQARSRRDTWCGRTGPSSGQALLAGVRVLGAADGQEARGGLGLAWPRLPCRAQPWTLSAGSLWARPARDPPCHTLGCSVSFQTVANCVQLVSLLEFMY